MGFEELLADEFEETVRGGEVVSVLTEIPCDMQIIGITAMKILCATESDHIVIRGMKN